MHGFRGGIWLTLLALGCSSPPAPKPPPPAAGPGVVFTWPRDGQRDVPAHAPVVLHFSDPLALTTLDGNCDTFCVEGPGGTLPGDVTVVAGDTITFSPRDGYEDGARYLVHARAALLPTATNLTADPLLSFVARQTRAVPGAPPEVVAFADAPLDAGTLPFLDVMPLRLLLSEPVDPATVTPSTVRLTGSDGSVVAASLIAGGAHLVVDPVADLTAGETYTLTLNGVKDLGGEALAPFSLTVTPKRAAAEGQDLYAQTLALAPAWQANGTQPASALSGAPVNASLATSALIGSATLGLLAGGLQAQLGDPAGFGGPIPMVIRKGQTLDLSPLAIRFGGALESGYQTGNLHFTVLDDAVGFLTRSPLRPLEQLPDDRSPVFVDLTMDTVLTAEDAEGNALATQTLMGLRLLGISTDDVDQLAVDQIGALELGTLGVNVAPTTLALRLRTGATLSPPTPAPPTLSAAYPANSALDAPPDARLELIYSAPLTVDGATLALTENGAAVPFSARNEGSTLIVQPGRRLADGAAVKLTWSGLTSLHDQPVADGQLSFSTATVAGTTAPPMIASVTTGAPCVLVGGGTMSPGSCVGGQGSDTPYVPFALASNLPLEVGFTQPMRASTLVQGQSCGTGGVRIEALDASGGCTGPVSGTLRASDRGFNFMPAKPWTVGGRYRLVLAGGLDGSCDANELCSAAGIPLNTDPLSGQGSAGGSAATLPFTITAATPDTLQPFETLPFADQNANGDLDPGETPSDDNRVAMEITNTGGIVTDASLNGADCVPSRTGTQVCTALHAELPVIVGAVQPQCPIDATGKPASSGGPCLQVRVMPNVIFNTSLSMNTTVAGLLPINNLPTHGLLMRVREPGGPQLGYIMNEAGQTYPQFVITQSIYLDAPDLSIAGGLATHDLHSKPLSIVLKGPVQFLADGRMHVALKNLSDVALTVNISALGLGGNIDMNIPQGEMHVTLVGPPLR